MRSVLFAVLLILFAGIVIADVPGVKEYYYFFSVESFDDLRVVHLNEMGDVLDGPHVLSNAGTSVHGVAVSKNSSNQWVVFTQDDPSTRVRRWIFTPPGTLSGGQVVVPGSLYDFNIDSTFLLPGAITGTDESDSNVPTFKVGASGKAAGSPYRAIPRGGHFVFSDFRSDGQEVVGVSSCCAKFQVLLQKMKGNLSPSGDPIVLSQIDPSIFDIEMARISDNGQFVVAASDSNGLMLFKLSPTTRKVVGTDTFPPGDQLRHFDSTTISDDGSFVIYSLGNTGKITFLKTDGSGHFTGSPILLTTIGNHLNYAQMVRAN